MLEHTVTEGMLYESSLDCGCIRLTFGDLEHCGAGSLVKALKENGICGGWPDLFIAREYVGNWDNGNRSLLPLI